MENNVRKNYVVALAGPTAIGKTSIAIETAKSLRTEIVSADARQIYRQISIGTAKPTVDELAEVKHHFIDTHEITESFTAGDFEYQALETINAILETKQSVVMAGGTGLYHKAIIEGFDDFPKTTADQRNKWQQILDIDGISELQNALRKKDPSYAAIVDLNNAHRLIRALSVFDVSGLPFSTFLNKSKVARPFETIQIFLNTDREVLYDRINTRVDHMIENGLIAEVEGLIEHKDIQALQTIGYKEIFKYLDGEWSLDEAVDKVKQHSRNYAKRQITWYKNQGDWVEMEADIDVVMKTLATYSDLRLH